MYRLLGSFYFLGCCCIGYGDFVDNNLETVEVVFYMVHAGFDYSDILVVKVVVVMYVALCECIPSMMQLSIVGQKLMNRC